MVADPARGYRCAAAGIRCRTGSGSGSCLSGSPVQRLPLKSHVPDCECPCDRFSLSEFETDILSQWRVKYTLSRAVLGWVTEIQG
jgi:hypothetical protein